MIVREHDGYGPFFYSACLDCGWCSRPLFTEWAAGLSDDRHLAAKLAARSSADRRESTSSLTPPADAGGSVGTPAPCPKCNDTGMIPDPDRGSGWGPYWDTPCDCGAGS